MHFIGVFVCVYDYNSFAFVCPNYHCLFHCKLPIYAFYEACLSFLVCPFLVAWVGDLLFFWLRVRGMGPVLLDLDCVVARASVGILLLLWILFLSSLLFWGRTVVLLRLFGFWCFLCVCFVSCPISCCSLLSIIGWMICQLLFHVSAHFKCALYSCSFSFYFSMYRNFISWLMRKCVAFCHVFWRRLLFPFTRMDIYLGVICLSLHVLLYQMAASCSIQFPFYVVVLA
jgi:hypothetical protein